MQSRLKMEVRISEGIIEICNFGKVERKSSHALTKIMKILQSLCQFILFLYVFSSLSFTASGQTVSKEKSQKKSAGFEKYSKELAEVDNKIIRFQYDKNDRRLAKAYEEKGDLLRDEHLGVSVVYYENALELYQKIKSSEDIFRLLKSLALDYTKIDDRQNALKKNYSLLDYYLNQNDTLRIAQAYSAIGSLYGDMGENDRALKNMLKALSMAIEMKSKVGEAAIRNNIAGVYKDLGEIDRAFVNVRKAKRLNEEVGNEYWLSINYMTLFDLFSELREMDSARYYLFKANEYYYAKGDILDSIDMFRKTGIYYMDVDSMDKALNMFNQGVLASRRVGSLKSEANIAHWISELYERNGKMDLALSFLQQRHDLLDSLRARERGKQLEEFYVLHEVKSLETELTNSTRQVSEARADANHNKTRFYLILGVLLAVLIGAMIIIFQYRKQARSNRRLLEMHVNSTKREETPPADKYAQSNLTDQKKQEILVQLMDYMVNEQLFIDQNLTLNAVAQKLEVSRTYLSQVINETYSQNFTSYINSYRINLAKKYLISEEYDKYSIQGIAEMVGFKSVSAFNTSFKKNTGLAPSYYRKNGKEI